MQLKNLLRVWIFKESIMKWKISAKFGIQKALSEIPIQCVTQFSWYFVNFEQ